MTRRWVNRAGLGIFAVLGLLAIANCNADMTAPAASPTTDADALLSNPFDLLGSKDDADYTFIQEHPLFPLPPLSVSQLIGVSGGTISVMGHSLVVPAGAVSTPTLFTMTLPRLGYVEVELHATVTDLLGRLIDVGASGFDRPVTLSMTYARATNVDDPRDLVILHKRGNNKYEVIPSVLNQSTKRLTAQLEHFSGYCMASN